MWLSGVLDGGNESKNISSKDSNVGKTNKKGYMRKKHYKNTLRPKAHIIECIIKYNKLCVVRPT